MSPTLDYLKTEKRSDILSLAGKHGIENVRVFGSVVRGQDGPNSDVDFLVTLEKGGGINEWFNFWHDVEDLLGKDIDVAVEKNLHWFIKPQILAEAVPL